MFSTFSVHWEPFMGTFYMKHELAEGTFFMKSLVYKWLHIILTGILTFFLASWPIKCIIHILFLNDLKKCANNCGQNMFFKSHISWNLTEIQCKCKLDPGKVLWNWLYVNNMKFIHFGLHAGFSKRDWMISDQLFLLRGIDR